MLTGAVATYGCYTEGQLSFGITDIRCNGTEDHLVNCSHSNAVLYNCASHNDAGLVCQGIICSLFTLMIILVSIVSVQQSNCTNGEVRLVGGSGPHEGRVEVCVNEAWGTVCSNNWDTNDANVVCSQLEYLPIG